MNLRHYGKLSVSASDSATAAALATHLLDLLAVRELSVEGTVLGRQDKHLIASNGAHLSHYAHVLQEDMITHSWFTGDNGRVPAQACVINMLLLQL